jgi:putative Ca2+/H+ antiporter (TMEM165/GDT1 family)
MIDAITALQPLLVSTATVVLAEIGDKTQLLALLLAARFRKHTPILLGIFFATILNHTVAAWVGAWLAGVLPPLVLRWSVVACFLAVAIWALVPDKLDDGEEKPARYGAFITTLVAFFLVEIGDKTQVATVLLAARYHPLWQVISGTTLGMMLADGPIVMLGAKFAHRLPLTAARVAAAVMFAALGLWVAIYGLGG